MRAALYLIPVVVWLFVTLLFHPNRADEFAFAAAWLLIPLAMSYVVWVPLVEIGLGLARGRAKRAESCAADAQNVVLSVLAAVRAGASPQGICPLCKSRVQVLVNGSLPASVQLKCACGACSGNYSVARASS
jgi:hypothetical protein